jgi:hypothetical protein
MKMRNLVRLTAVAGLLVGLPACAPRVQAQEEPARWDFTPPPDDFAPGARLDLRSLNEKVAGESGFVKMNGNGDLLLGNGKPARFWAVNTSVGREKPFTPRPLWNSDAPDLGRHARFLAKRGVNMVRCHAHLNPDVEKHPKVELTSINTGDRDWIWRTVAAMKKEGIYTTLSPYWANTTHLSAEWNIPGGAKQSTHGLLFFDETLQKGYKGWLRALFAEKNPYTGIPLAQDPAVAIIQIQNEDSLLFWTVSNLSAEQKKRLGRKFGQWLTKKYGSLNAAFAAWQGDKLPGDDAAASLVDFHHVWEMTQKREGGRAKRLDDQTQFWTETMHAFNKQIADYLRNELGCKQLINAGNWRTADTGRLNDAERWSYTANEVLAVNRYVGGMHVGPNQGWAITNGDQFTKVSALRDPSILPTNVKQAKGHAMLVTESSWVPPNGYATEGPFLLSVYQSLTGVDGYYWFATSTEQWTPPQSANGYMPSQGKWIMATPDAMGNFPAAALMYRKGYIKRGSPAVSEERALADLWQRRPGIIIEESGYDPNRDSGNLAPTSSVKEILPWEAFLVGPVEVKYGGDPAKSKTADLAKYIDREKKIVKSVTGEVTLDYGRGYCLLDAPCAQGVAALFRNQKTFKTKDTTITSGNPYGAVYAVSMDGKPLKESGQILVQVGTESQPTGWRESPTTISVNEGKFEGFKVESFGKAPWQVVRADVTLTVANPSLKKATVLDMNGKPVKEIPLQRTATGVELRFREPAMYVVLQ